MTGDGGKVLITGGSGFVGRPAVNALLARGFQIHCICRKQPRELPAQVKLHCADLLDSEQRRMLLRDVRPDYLLHLAWYVEHGQFWTSPENGKWVEASIDLLKHFAEHGGRRAVFASTCAEYDWTGQALAPWREDRACRPATIYGRAKLQLAQQGVELAAQAGIGFAWARFFLMFGLGENPRRVIPLMTRGLILGEEVPLGSGIQLRDFMDTRDVAGALAAIVTASDVVGPVNVASGRGATLREIGRILARAAKAPEDLLKFGAIPDRHGEPAAMIADVSRLRNEAGFELTQSLEERLAQYFQWYEEQIGSISAGGLQHARGVRHRAFPET